MAEDLYPLIFVLLMFGLIVIDTWALAEEEYWIGSELHASDRYAVAEQILCRQALCW